VSGKLFVCATPIGNLEDVSFRLVRVLGEVDLVAAEDTRRTRKLLTHHGIRARLTAYHQANEHKQTDFLTNKLKEGKQIALVSDGGMPGISDPGYLLIRACIEQQIDMEVIPGPSSVVTALVLSGLETARFAFEGFLPKPAGEKRARLKALAEDDRTLVFFEAPGRLRATLEAVLEVLGDRQAAMGRELTKLHEEVRRGSVGEILQGLDADLLGEIVLVVGGKDQQAGSLAQAVDFAKNLVGEGASKSQAAAGASAAFSVPRRSIYEGLIRDITEPD
jgi:16S rRNA (cytidine1402-2'-O)-methyltransferase